MIKDIYAALKENPSALLMTVLLAGASMVYSDFREYISETQAQQKLQFEKQQELNAKFVDALNDITCRLDLIERNLNKQ